MTYPLFSISGCYGFPGSFQSALIIRISARQQNVPASNPSLYVS
jgi:hypothetical protein